MQHRSWRCDLMTGRMPPRQGQQLRLRGRGARASSALRSRTQCGAMPLARIAQASVQCSSRRRGLRGVSAEVFGGGGLAARSSRVPRLRGG
eukprot:2633605-Pyramimonas_sp.AAC.1